MSITRENYHDFHGVSNSSLGYALPESGGSYKKFTSFMAGEIAKEETPEMKLGTLIHKYLENPRGFSVTVIENMPSEALCRIVKNIKLDGSRVELKDYAKEAVHSARELSYQKGWGDEAIAKKILTDCSEYFKAMVSGAEIIDKAISTKLYGIVGELTREFPTFISDADFTADAGPDWKVMKEVALTWDEDDITFKMLIDRMEINEKLKYIKFYDYKTTSTPLSFYTGYNGHEIIGEKREDMKLVAKFVHGTMIRYQVPRQIRFYTRGLKALFPGYTVEGFVLAIEVNSPYEMKLVDISKLPIYEEYGDALIERALVKVKEFYEKEISI